MKISLRKNRPAKILILLFVMFAVNSCSIFETREPEVPSNSANTFAPATTPDILFENLKAAFKEGVVENYLACLVDNATLNKEFVFQASSTALNKYSALTNWSLNLERLYFTNIVSLAENKQMILLLENGSGIVQGDSALFSFDYTISVPFETNQFEGSAEFTIFLDNRNQWFITRWRDIEKSNKQSWSELKGKYN